MKKLITLSIIIIALLSSVATADTVVYKNTGSYAFVYSSPLQATMTDGQTLYWGELALVPTTTADAQRTYFPKPGSSIIRSIIIYVHCGTAGSNENWSMYIRVNNTTDYLVQTVGVSSATRTWVNSNLNIPVYGPVGSTAGDYHEIKEVQPTWGTNPANCKRNTTVFME